MAPNSLFAILLRSPWWISMSLALVLAVGGQAVLPPQWSFMGAALGLPLFGLALVAFWRQWRRPSPRAVEALQQELAGLGWAEFAARLAHGFERQGYQVEPLTGGADLRLARSGRRTLVSARRWKAARHGLEPLQALQQAARAEDASGMAYVALGDLTPQALRFAEAQGIRLLQAPELAQLLRAS